MLLLVYDNALVKLMFCIEIKKKKHLLKCMIEMFLLLYVREFKV